MLSFAMSVRPFVCPSAIVNNYGTRLHYIYSTLGLYISERSLVLKFELQVANLCNLLSFSNKFVCMALTDQLLAFAEYGYACTLYD